MDRIDDLAIAIGTISYTPPIYNTNTNIATATPTNYSDNSTYNTYNDSTITTDNNDNNNSYLITSSYINNNSTISVYSSNNNDNNNNTKGINGAKPTYPAYPTYPTYYTLATDSNITTISDANFAATIAKVLPTTTLAAFTAAINSMILVRTAATSTNNPKKR